MGAARTGRRALPRGARRPRAGGRGHRRTAGPGRPGRRHPPHPRCRIPVRHPLDRRPRGPAEDHPGGPHIARTRRYIRNFAHEIEPADLVEYVGREARRGDGWVKLVGDWIDREAGDLAACWPRAEVEAAIAEAHRLGARVTAHCFAEDSLRDLVEAGIDCVEHATGLTEDTIPLFAERGVAIVPTLVNIATFPKMAAGGEAKFPRWSAHMRRLHERRYDTVRSAYDAGIGVYVGTDAGVPCRTAWWRPRSASSSRPGSRRWRPSRRRPGAREWLGRPGLTEGAPADLVVYEADPRADVRALAQPLRVVVNGRVVA